MMERYGKSYQELNFKEKIEYLWEYYRWKTVGTIVVVVLVVAFVGNLLRPQKVNDVDIVMAGKVVANDDMQQVVDQYEEELKTGLYVTSMDWENMGQFEMTMMQKIPLMMQTGELDVLILPTATFLSYLNQTGGEIFMPLEEIPELEGLLASQVLITDEDMAKVDAEGNTIEVGEHIFGIKATRFENLPFIEGTEEMVIGITHSAKDVTKAARMIDYLMP